MDFYQSMLASGAIVETPEELERKRRLMLERTRRNNAGGTVTSTVQPGEENIRRALELYNQEDDYSQAQQYARTRAQESDSAMLNAFAAQIAGKRFEPVAATYLKRSLAAREPLRIGSATISPDGTVLKDPGASRQRQAQALMQLGELEMRLADRRDERNEAAWLRQSLAGQGSWQHVQDPNTGEVVLYNSKTRETQPLSGFGGVPAIAQSSRTPGFSLPPGGVPKLTDVQDKARFFADNMSRSLPAMLEVFRQGYVPNRSDQVAAGPPATGIVGKTADAFTPRSFASDQGRQFYTAGRQVLAAILRKESGAAITDDEWSSYGPIYLPWPGDSDQERKRKMADLQSMANSMAMSSGPAYRFWSPFNPEMGAGSSDGVVDLTPGQ